MSDEIRFRFLKEEKGADGSSIWSSGVTSPPVNIEDVSVTTQALTQIISEGPTPKIIPYGVKGDGGRVASLVGTFSGYSMDTSQNVQMDEYLDVLQDDPKLVGYGISITGTNAKLLLPELGIPGETRWRIEQFSWDRAARQLGQWKFNITLGYIWDATKNEIKLYDDGIGTNTKEHVKFSAALGIGRSNFAAGTPIYSPKITTTMHDLNRATFKTPTTIFSRGDIIHIYCETDKYKAIFFGEIREAKNNSDGTSSYDCVEIGTLLQRVPCAKMAAGLFKPKIKIPNPYKKGTYYSLNAFISKIMRIYASSQIKEYDPGMGVDKSGNGNSPYIPGSEQYIPAQLLSGMNVLAALDNLVEKQCGMHTWFDNDTGKLEYGYLRDIKTINPTTEYIVNTVKESSLSGDFEPDYVILCDNNGYYARSMEGDVRGKSYMVYKIDTTLVDAQLRERAIQIANALKRDASTYVVSFPAGTVKFRDGDVFAGLGDQTVDPVMEWRGGEDTDPTSNPTDEVWQVRELIITDSYTQCIVGSSYYSILDIFQNSLKPVAEMPVLTETKDVTTNNRVVAPTVSE